MRCGLDTSLLHLENLKDTQKEDKPLNKGRSKKVPMHTHYTKVKKDNLSTRDKRLGPKCVYYAILRCNYVLPRESGAGSIRRGIWLCTEGFFSGRLRDHTVLFFFCITVHLNLQHLNTKSRDINFN